MRKRILPLALATAMILQPLSPFSSLMAKAASEKTGIVQLWQEIPSGQKMPKGMTEAELKEKLYCRLNHTLTPASDAQNYNTYVNSCYVDDVLYLGESGSQYKIYVSGYEGWVDKQKAGKIKLSFNVNDQEELVPTGTPGSYLKDYEYTVYTTAQFLPTSAESTHELVRTVNVEEMDYAKYEGDYLKSAASFEEALPASFTRSGQLKSPSYYANEKGQLVHYISENVLKSNAYSKTTVGLAPSWMKANQPYYSYDGVYFYTNLAAIDPSGVGAVNEGKPYYNYYQYLPVRSNSQIPTTALDQYTASKGYTQTPTGSRAKSNESQLVGRGDSFGRSQSVYGVNQTLQYAMAIHESAFGRSSLSVNKNNLFGMNASDLDPSGLSTAFESVEQGILHHANAYLSKGYTDPLKDERYFGAHLGNKGSGMNVKYASDPYWGEKIAGHYHQIDKANGYADLNYYSLAVIDSSQVASVYQEPSTQSTVFYQAKNGYRDYQFRHYPLMVVDDVGEFYQIKTDTPINAQGTTQFDAIYDWDLSTGYVLKSAITSLTPGTYIEGETPRPTTTEKPDYLPTVTPTTNAPLARSAKQGTVTVDDLKIRSGAGVNYGALGSFKKGQTVEIVEEGSEWHKIRYNNGYAYVSAAYVDLQSIPDTSTNSSTTSSVQKGTVTTDNLKVRSGAGTSHSILGTLDQGTTVEIVDVGTSWHRIKFGTGYGYVSADYIELKKTSSSSTEDSTSTSKAPDIRFKNDLVIEVGSSADLLKDVSVVNAGTQGYVLDVRQSNVDFMTTGTYTVEYVAKYGENLTNELTKTRTVIVKDTQAPKLTLKGPSVITLRVGEPYEEYGASVSDNSGELVKYYIAGSDIDTDIKGVYRVKYTATDSSGNTSTVTREVRVQDPSAPILTLEGDTYMVLRGGEPYVEPGYKAVDGNGNLLTVTVKGNDFDPLKEGQYTIEYSTESAPGLKASATRVIIVKDVPLSGSQSFIGTGKPTVNNVNVRTGRGTSYSVLGTLGLEEEVNVYDLKDNWYKIDFDGQEGYIRADVLTFTEKVITPEEVDSDNDLPFTPHPDDSMSSGGSPGVMDSPQPETPSNEVQSVLPYLTVGFVVCLVIVVIIVGVIIFLKFKNRDPRDPNPPRSSYEPSYERFDEPSYEFSYESSYESSKPSPFEEVEEAEEDVFTHYYR